MINDLWIQALQPFVPAHLKQNGIICCGEKKIAGTSIFRKKHLLVYQGSMLIDVDINSISGLLAHPSKEPSYRQGRSHEDFLTTLKQLGCQLSAQDLTLHCQDYFNQNIEKHLKNDFLEII